MKALLGIFAFNETDFAEIMKLIIAKKSNDDKCKKPCNDKIKEGLTEPRNDERGPI